MWSSRKLSMLQSNLLPSTVLRWKQKVTLKHWHTSYHTARHKIPEGSNLPICYHKNFKSHIPSGFLTSLNYRRGLYLTELVNNFKTIPSVCFSKMLVTIWQGLCHNPEAHNEIHYQGNYNLRQKLISFHSMLC